jgi:uncharacterized protein YqgV (UPF0045/DUF77 family)
MTITSAQISIYPLRQDRLRPAIEAVREALGAHGLTANVGPMSTTAVGEDRAIFAALADAFAKAAETGQVVMSVTVSNACPVAN